MKRSHQQFNCWYITAAQEDVAAGTLIEPAILVGKTEELFFFF